MLFYEFLGIAPYFSYLVIGIVLVICLSIERKKKKNQRREAQNRRAEVFADKNLRAQESSESESVSVQGTAAPNSAPAQPDYCNRVRPKTEMFRNQANPRSAQSDYGRSEPVIRSKSFRVLAVITASICLLDVFAMVAVGLFQIKSATYYAVSKLDRYLTPSRAKAYFALSVICTLITAAAVIITFARWRNIYRSQIYFGSFFMIIPLYILGWIFWPFFADLNVKGVLVMSVIFTVIACIYVAITFLPFDRVKRKHAVSNN